MPNTRPVDFDVLARTTDDTFSLEDFKKKLSTGKQLRIKYGVDVTAPFLHIGHAVNLWMMRYLQELGHKVVFLIGDFTTRIGDPTGKSKTRVVPSREEIESNAQRFIEQVGTVLLTTEDVFEVRRNSEWFDQMPMDEFLSLLSMVTHARLIQRDMFQRRLDNNEEIFVHELLYPILQGYDSKMLESDLTIVGSDQLFNEMMGRFYQSKFDQESQVVLTTKITPGTDGKAKQSKTLGNYIAMADAPRDMFGKMMSIPDHLIWSYLEVYTDAPIPKIEELRASVEGGQMNPRDAKLYAAQALVLRYHGQETADAEKAWFLETFSKKKIPDDVPEIKVSATNSWEELLQLCLPNDSKSAIRRLVRQGAIKFSKQSLSEGQLKDSPEETDFILQIGKRRWFKVKQS